MESFKKLMFLVTAAPSKDNSLPIRIAQCIGADGSTSSYGTLDCLLQYGSSYLWLDSKVGN